MSSLCSGLAGAAEEEAPQDCEVETNEPIGHPQVPMPALSGEARSRPEAPRNAAAERSDAALTAPSTAA